MDPRRFRFSVHISYVKVKECHIKNWKNLRRFNLWKRYAQLCGNLNSFDHDTDLRDIVGYFVAIGEYLNGLGLHFLPKDKFAI